MTELLAEGADLVLEKYERVADKELLLERARKAKDELRSGLFEGGDSSHAVDRIVYELGSPSEHKQRRPKGGRKE